MTAHNILLSLVLVSLFCNLISASSSCTAEFNIYTQPPNWPTGLNAQLNLNVLDSSVLANGWAINFTAKGYGSTAPFSISSFWNVGSVSVIDNGDNTFTYTLTNANYNAQTPKYIGFNADTTLAHPHNVICGVAINNIPCSTVSSPVVSPPTPTPSSILLSYDFHNADSNLPLLVLVHGITENRQSWDPLIPLFTPHYRVLAVDLRGHGQSQVTIGASGYEPDSLASDVYRTILHALSTSSGSHELDSVPLIVGHSLGGTVVSVYAHLYPIRGLICVDQSMELGAFQASILSIEPFLTGDQQTFLYVIDQLFSGLYGSLNASEVARLDALRNPIQNVVLGVWSLLIDLTLDELNATVDILMQTPGGTRYLSLFGADPGTAYASWLSSRVPGAVTELWGDGSLGHYPHLIYPQRFVQRVLDFDAAATQDVCL